MSRYAWCYLWAVLLSAIGLAAAFHLAMPAPDVDLPTFTVLMLLAVAAQLFEVQYGRQSYYPHFVPFFAGVVLLPPVAFLLLIIVPHLVEWLKKHWSSTPYPWYIQPFNIATHGIAGLTAHQVFLWMDGSFSILSFQSTVLAASAAIAAYTLINHLLIGQALVLARQISWAESGVMDGESLATDGVMMSLGYVMALLWTLAPWLLLPVLSPVLLLYRALKVPQLEKQTQTDEKTGLWNAPYFKRRLAEELVQAEAQEQSLAVIMADLDLLRDINNHHGHLAGDAVIAGIGRIIRQTIRKEDIACRFGGEEYAIVLPNVDRIQATAMAERIRQNVAATPFQVSSNSAPIHVSMSLGLACYPEDGTSMEALTNGADVALYQAKVQGRNRVISMGNVPHSLHMPMAHPQLHADRRVASPAPVAAPAPAAPAEKTTEPQAETAHPTPSRWLWFFVGGTIGAGVVAGAWAGLSGFQGTFASLATLGGLALLAQWLQIEMYEKSSVSISMAIIFASAVVSGMPGAVVTSTAVVLVHYLRMRPRLYKSLFNWACHVLASIGPVLALHFPLHTLHLPLHSGVLLWWTLPVLVAALFYYLCESGLVAAAIALSEGSSIVAGWREQFRWLARHYLVMGVLGFFLALAFMHMSLLGVLVFSLPILIMHLTQKEYIERTSSSVRELRRMNRELSQANGEVLRANHAIEQLNRELFVTLAKIIDARDPYVSGHATKVGEYARSIAAELDFPPLRLDQIYQAGLLHDIGKIGIPETLLHKPGRLTTEEYEIVKQHAALGAEFLASSCGLRHLAPFVRHHHERWDGTGYPDGLQAEQIPLEARILAVCDAVEAMASDRPYQRALPLSTIRQELARGAGTQFDPAVVEAFIRVLEHQEEFVVNSALTVMQTHQNLDAVLTSHRIDSLTLNAFPAR